MPITFSLSRLSIESFRGIHSLDITLPTGAPLVLIGSNNAGKSTVLDAVALALGGPSFANFAPERFDYFHDGAGKASDSFEVTMHFAAASDNQYAAVRGGYGDPVAVHGVRVQGSVDRNGSFTHEVRLIDQASKAILLPSALPLKGDAKETWKEHGLSFQKRYARWSDLGEHRPEVWLLRPDNLYVSLYQWRTGPLHRLANLLARKFFDTEWEFRYESRMRRMPESMHQAHRFLSEAMKEFPFWRDDLKPRLEETLSVYIGRQARLELRPDLRAVEEWLAEQLILSFSADAGAALTPLNRMGHGWQTLVRIAALDVLSQYPGETRERVVLLFEEPESFLHPHLARKLRGVLGRLASSGWTVLTSTHSPNLISFSEKQDIARLTRSGDQVACKTLHHSDINLQARFQERLDERGGHEMVFAQKAVLCEGQDDVFALRSYLTRRANVDLDARSISVVRAGDVGQIATYAAMAGKLGIPWCAVSDEDRLPDGSIKQATAEARERASRIKGQCDHLIEWPVDLEHCLDRRVGKADPAWQAKCVEPLETQELLSRCPAFVETCEAVRQWIEQ